MSWYLGQFWLLLILGFVLGVLVGYWWWRRQFTRASVSASTSTQGSCGHGPLLAEKDAEITRLRAAVSGTGHVEGDADGDSASDGPGLLDRVSDDTSGAAAVTTDGEAAHLVDGSVDGSVATDAVVDGSAHGDSVVDGSDHDSTAEVTEAVEADQAPAEVHPHDHGDAHVHGDAHAVDQGDTAAAGVLDDAEATTQVHLADGASAAGLAPEVGDGHGAGPAPDAEHDVAAGLATSGLADAAPDDLERVEGIGPRIAGALKAAGIHTFRGLSEADVATLQSALEAGGLRFAPSLPTWARQAKLLADGDEAGFKALTDRLVAGRDTGSNG